MRLNEKDEETRLREAWPPFLKTFLIKIKELFKGKFSMRCEDKSKDSLLIKFNFGLIKGKEVYRLLAQIAEMVDTKGILNKLTVMLAKITNLAEKDDNFYDFQTRGDSIYRGINRYRKLNRKNGDFNFTTQQGYLPAKSIAGAGCGVNQNW